MDQWHAARQLTQKLRRVMPCYADPEAIELESTEVFVQAIHHQLESGRAFHRLELEGMVVIAETQAGGTAFLAGAIQLVRKDTDLLQATALGWRQVRKHGESEAPFLR